MKMDGFEFQYTFDNKEDYTLYSKRYTTAYSEQSDRIRAGGFQIYTSLDSGLQAVAPDADRRQSFGLYRASGKRKICPSGRPV